MRSSALWPALAPILSAQGWHLLPARPDPTAASARQSQGGCLFYLEMSSKMIGADYGRLSMTVYWGSAPLAELDCTLFAEVEERVFLTGGVIATGHATFDRPERAQAEVGPCLRGMAEAMAAADPDAEVTRMTGYCPDGPRVGHRMAHVAALAMTGQTDVLDDYARTARGGAVGRLAGLRPEAIVDAANTAWAFV